MSETPSSTVNLEEASSGRPFLKNGEYGVRCISVEKKKSKKNNDMLQIEYEIVSPPTVKVTTDTGTEVERPVAGLKVTDWIVFNDMGWGKLKDLHKACLLPLTFDKANPALKQYLGKAVKVSLTTEPTPIKDENTGEAMLDDKGNPQVMNNYRIQRYNKADPENTIPADTAAF